MTRARFVARAMLVGGLAGSLCVGAAFSSTRAESGRSTTPAAPGVSVIHAKLISAQPVAFVPGTIDYTGATDVTDALQTFIDHVRDGWIVRFHRNGRYRVEGTILVVNRTLTFDGQNATVFATTPGTLERSQWWITDGSGIIFRHLIVRGANPHAGLADDAYVPKLEKQHGFRIEGVQGLELDHVTVTDVYGDFVYIARDLAFVPSTNVWIHDSTFRRDGRQGISLIATEGVIIERNTIADTRRSTIDLEPNGPNQSVSNAFVLNNAVGPGRLLFVAAHGKGPVDNIVIFGNRLHNHLMTIDDLPPKDERRSNWIVAGNTSDSIAHSRPMRFFETDAVVVAHNTQPIDAGQSSVELTNVCGDRIANNDFGTASVHRVGPICTAPLTFPGQPTIPGRV